MLELIRTKKSKVGAGYLTEQGALFLVASDLGVTVSYDPEKPASLSHLTVDQKSIMVTARILSVGVPKIFTRKSDSRKGLITKLFIYDNSTQSVATLWDSTITKLLDEKLDLRPGDLVRLAGAYTRPGLDGSPLVNLGEDGTVEKSEENVANVRIDPLERRTFTTSDLGDAGKKFAVRGKIQGEPKKSSFTRADGSPSEYIAFDISDENDANKVRAVIWNNSNPAMNKLHAGEIVTLLNMRSKLSTFQNGTMEIHGDENTCILEYFEETRKWMSELVQAFRAQGILRVQDDAKKPILPEAVPFIARILSLQKADPAEGRSHMLVVDSQKRKISVTVSGDAEHCLKGLVAEDLVLCRPETADYTALRASCVRPNSLTKVGAKRPDIPLSSSLFARVEDLVENNIASLDLICLTAPVSREIQTKDGLVRRSEVLVADHTGEIKLYAWRGLAKLLERYAIGERIEARAVEVQSFEGKKFIVMKNYSSVAKSQAAG